MKTQTQTKQKKAGKRDWLPVLALLGLSALLLVTYPGHRAAATDALLDFSSQLFSIFPAILILMGLFSAWATKELVLKYLGRESGIKGVALALFFGALPTGPLYIAFPLAAILKKKGASAANLVIFLSAWACIKISQEMIEWQFLGWRFMVTRLVLTLVLVVLMGFTIEIILDRRQNKISTNP